ncbi:uncharacterized protein [Aegilops tauschii subsp. strangulata]|uniref:uncharacterized protein n=1 Tax=Aegilops tauschii subsp. strangulata TaxID=200361 RepID=UPI003CC87095
MGFSSELVNIFIFFGAEEFDEAYAFLFFTTARSAALVFFAYDAEGRTGLAVPSRGRGKGGKKRGVGGRGRGRGGRVTARARSSPPPPAVSPEHVTARVDSSEEEATRTPVHEPSAHEPRVDGPLAYEPWVDAPSAHETPEEHTSGWGTLPDEPEGPSGHADDGGEPTDIEEEGGTVYQRGCTRLPSVPATREQRWLIFPDGERGWDHHHSVRRPNSVLGVLCRQNFPGFVTLPGEGRLPELGLSWEHYLAAPAPPGEIIDGVLCDTRADVVIRKFWTFYRCEEGYEEEAANVIENVCKRLLQNLRHEARVQAVRDYYALRGIKKPKPACRNKFLKSEHIYDIIELISVQLPPTCVVIRVTFAVGSTNSGFVLPKGRPVREVMVSPT